MFKLATLAVVAASASAHDFSVCKKTTDNLAITAIDLNPDPPVVGADLNVAISATPNQEVTSGTANLKIKSLGITVLKQDFDICDLAACPLAADTPVQLSIDYPLPSSTPAGVSATAEITFEDGSGTELSCVDMSVKASKSSSLRGEDEVAARKSIEFLFEAHRQEYGLEYSPEEYAERLEIFAANHAYILDVNSQGLSYHLGHNRFSAMTWDEFSASYMGFERPASQSDRVADYLTKIDPASLPDAVDWRDHNAVNPVKDQGQCGSCWAFSATAAVEGAHAISSGNLISLSEQQVVSCDTQSEGCNGGLMDYAFEYIEKNGGQCLEADYPYEGKTGTCDTSCSPAAQISGYSDVPTNDEDALKAAVAGGVVSVAIEADKLSFQLYSGGVFDNDKCGDSLDHGVAVVGYGTMDGADYWTVRNSWGESWGDAGYILLARNVGGTGMCGILSGPPSYPTV